MGELRRPKQQPYHTGNALLGGEGALDIHLIYYLEPRAVSRPRFHEEWWFPHLHVCIISSGTLSVSYTHLLFLTILFHEVESKHVVHLIIAVSYTHLDVYKRQHFMNRVRQGV